MNNNNLVSDANVNPLVTFALFAYNQETYIREAVEGALLQTYSPLEIILSDDCSSDKTFEIMRSMAEEYNGPHQIKLNRNQNNFGLIDHVNKVFEISSGDFIVLAAGDDISLPHRVKRLVDVFIGSKKKAILIHSSATKIDRFNIDLGIFIPPIINKRMSIEEMVDSGSLYIGATAAISKLLYHEFGPIVFRNAYEDLVLGFRAAIKDSLIYVNEPLVRYRVNHGMTTQSALSFFYFRLRVEDRRKKIAVLLDVFKQRLIDLDKIKQSEKIEILKARLLNNISYQKKRLVFYRNPLSLCYCLSDYNVVFKVLLVELKYLIGLKNSINKK